MVHRQRRAQDFVGIVGERVPLADVFPREEFGHAERDRTLDAVGDHLRLDVVEADMLGEKVGALGGRNLLQNRENQVALAREQVYPAVLR